MTRGSVVPNNATCHPITFTKLFRSSQYLPQGPMSTCNVLNNGGPGCRVVPQSAAVPMLKCTCTELDLDKGARLRGRLLQQSTIPSGQSPVGLLRRSDTQLKPLLAAYTERLVREGSIVVVGRTKVDRRRAGPLQPRVTAYRSRLRSFWSSYKIS